MLSLLFHSRSSRHTAYLYALEYSVRPAGVAVMVVSVHRASSCTEGRRAGKSRASSPDTTSIRSRRLVEKVERTDRQTDRQTEKLKTSA